jgi:dihydroorotase
MANTEPVADTAGVVEQVWRLGERAGWAQVRPVGAVTVGLRGEWLAELGAMARVRRRGPGLLRRRPGVSRTRC